ncbi:shikimate dehydrogenase [Roseomonas eburnea]|uniref:Shikimate dehydrogenase (NADP(+)) n=1 Tax=Neoroseomonas eburnea TaxID=1346889 RepID=A0A9X9XJ31_9PROT|nr:shikimate dehydrogenase [Neoroseomonas eburnea]MBR0683717.1 shikimate dehydrogenase [Neoroseomonas eburnea]
MRRWDQRPSVLEGLIGYGIQASLTPALHEREGAEQGLRLVYRRIDLEVLGLGPEALPELLTAAERMGFAGLNITFPCKQAVIPLLHDLSEEARALGAVNTVVLRDGRRIGHNTDGSGFAEAFRRGLPGAPRGHVLLLGAGGAGAAVGHALLAEGVGRLAIADAEASRAEALATGLSSRFGAGRAVACRDPASVMAATDGLVNCTPVGMAKHPGTPLPVSLLRHGIWVADAVYFPLETELLRAARAIGCRTLDGGGMAVFQAVGAFRLFTGIAPDAGRMLRHFAEMTGR